MRATYQSINPINWDLCCDCPFVAFKILPHGHEAEIAVFCHRLDCDNMQTSPMAPLPYEPVLEAMEPRASLSGFLYRALRAVARKLREVW